MSTVPFVRLRYCLLLGLSLLGTLTAAPVGRIVDVVSATVVQVDANVALELDAHLVVRREERRIAWLKVRTELGVCQVLRQQVALAVGDTVYRPPEGAEPPAQRAPEPDTQTEASAPAARAEAPVPAQELKPGVLALLRHQGTLEVLRHLCQKLQRQDPALKDLRQDVDTWLPRVAAAARLLQADTPAARMAGMLRDVGEAALASRIQAEEPPPLRPRYPARYKALLREPGPLPLISESADVYGTPAFWGQPPLPPSFTGIRIDGDQATLYPDGTALIRTDFEADDVAVSGQFRIDEGSFVYLLLRSQIVVKFALGEGNNVMGNVLAKYGYNNLGSFDTFGNAPEIRPDTWYDFRVALEGDQLRVTVDGDQVLKTAIVQPDNLAEPLPESGHVGFGTFRTQGAFRKLRVKGLSHTARANLPRFRAGERWREVGEAVHVLADPQGFQALVHGQAQGYRDTLHPVAEGMLTVPGNPGALFTHKAMAGEHYRVEGRLRLRPAGRYFCGFRFQF